MTTRTTAVLITAMILATPAFAQEVQQPGAKSAAMSPATEAAPHAGKPVKEAKVCKREVPTGSIMAIKTCRTQAAWDGMAASGQENVKQLRDRSQATLGSPLGN